MIVRLAARVWRVPVTSSVRPQTMAIPLILALLIEGPNVDAALRNPSGQEWTAQFPNTSEGVGLFERWLASHAELTQETVAHSCVATPAPADDAFFSSPFIEFAHDNTDNTFVWSRERLNTVAGQNPSAKGMLQACYLERGRAV